MPYCANCGNEVAVATKFCPECGTPRTDTEAPTPASEGPEASASRFVDPKTGGEPTQKQTIGCLIVSVIILAGIAYTMFSGNDEPEQVESTPPPPPEYMLAVLDENRELSPSDPVVQQFSAALSDLEAKCPDDRSRISDFAVTARDQLQQRGVTESLLEILRNVNESIPASAGDGEAGPCSDIFATYVILRSP